MSFSLDRENPTGQMPVVPSQPPGEITTEEKVFVASQWQLMWWRFRRHKVANVGIVIIFLFYLLAVFCEFFACAQLLTISSSSC